MDIRLTAAESSAEPPAPASLTRVVFDVGPPTPFDFDAEFARLMRHQ